MRLARWASLLLVIPLFLIPPSPANARNDRADTLRIDDCLEPHRLRPGTRVRILPIGGELLQGRLLDVTEDALVVRTQERRAKVSLSRVESLWIRRDARGAGRTWGALAGALLGGLTLALVFGDADLDVPRGSMVGMGVVLGGLGGVVPGLLIGSGVGAMIHTWEPCP